MTLPIEFWLTDLHFVIGIFAALALVATAWLYWDAWYGTTQRSWRDLVKATGFGLLAVGMVATAATVELAAFGQTALGWLTPAADWLRLLGYAVIVTGLVFDPLQPRPKSEPEVAHPNRKSSALTMGMSGSVLQGVALPLLAASASFWYFRRAYRGLERHLVLVAWAFVWLGAYELMRWVNSLEWSHDPRMQDWVGAFGPVWVVRELSLLVAGIILGWWVWHYLVKRLQSQLVMSLTVFTVVIFMVTTVAFSLLLSSRASDQYLAALGLSSKAVHASLSAEQTSVAAAAQTAAIAPGVASAVAARNHLGLESALSQALSTYDLNSLVVLSYTGEVLFRAEDPSRWGDSMSSHPSVGRALIGRSTQGLEVAEGALVRRLRVTATVPLRDLEGKIIGAVQASRPVSTAYAKAVAETTGADVVMYAGDVQAEGSWMGQSQVELPPNLKQTHPEIVTAVLNNDQTWVGRISEGGGFIGTYTSLHNAAGQRIGILGVLMPESAVLSTAGVAIQLTFVIAVLLLGLFTLPVYWLARIMSR